MIFKNNFIGNKIAIMGKSELLISVIVVVIFMLMIFAAANETIRKICKFKSSGNNGVLFENPDGLLDEFLHAGFYIYYAGGLL